MSKRLPLILLALGALLSLVLSAWAEPPVRPFRLFRVGADPQYNGLAGLGTARCQKSLDLGFDLTGVITKMPVEEGQRVKKGQLLAKLDDRVARAELGAALAELNQAQVEAKYRGQVAKEKKALLDGRAISRAEYDKANFEAAQAQAALELTRASVAGKKARIASMTLTAPMAGVVAQRLAEPGEVVSPGSEQYNVIRLLACQTVLAEVDFSEKHYTRLRPGLKVIVTADALGGREFLGAVKTVSPEINEKDRTVQVKVKIDNRDFKLRPGMFVRAAVLGPPDAQLWVPAAAILAREGDAAVVEVAKGRKAEKRRIELGESKKSLIKVLSGLKQGELVVVPTAPPPGPEADKRP